MIHLCGVNHATASVLSSVCLPRFCEKAQMFAFSMGKDLIILVETNTIDADVKKSRFCDKIWKEAERGF
jgi:hypothetical protein